MELRAIKPNMTEIKLEDGLRVLFSYRTPVAVFIVGEGIYKTTTKWSATTTRHIRTWIGEWSPKVSVSEKPQDYFDRLISKVEVK